jgi:isoquinoline 1-oxidoreductase alpha subunit
MSLVSNRLQQRKLTGPPRSANFLIVGLGSSPQVFGGDSMAYKLTVNGQPHTVDVPEGTPLLWVVRDVLGLHGTKYGCGMALCGCCTVHINGEAVRSCTTAIQNAAGKHITTLEGLSENGTHPVQIAWEEIDVPQCGYCQAGQIMSASALLAKNPHPSDADIDAAMDGNICRCGTYLRIRKAIHKAAEIAAKQQPKEPVVAAHS